MEDSLIQIFIHAVDGTDVWIPALAKKLASNTFQIISCESYDPEDTSTVLDFLPGNIVKVAQRSFSDGSIGLIAVEIVKP